jgi:hypothetical protein
MSGLLVAWMIGLESRCVPSTFSSAGQGNEFVGRGWPLSAGVILPVAKSLYLCDGHLGFTSRKTDLNCCWIISGWQTPLWN